MVFVYREMIDQPSSSVKASQDGADNFVPFLRNEKQIRVALELLTYLFGFVGR